MMTGFLPPSEGRVTVGGRDLFAEPVEVRGQIGYLPEHVSLYPEMRVREYLAYRARLQRLSGAGARDRISEAIESCLLGEVQNQIIETLSKGYRQRVGLATAILHRPAVLILDEPTVGLDPKQILAIRKLILELGRDRTLMISTHILSEVELLCDRVMILDRGRVIAEGTPESLRERSAGNTVVRVGLKEPSADAQALFEGLPGVLSASPAGEAGFRLECEAGMDPREAVFRAAVERGWVLIELAETKASLEDVFVRLTTRDDAASELPAEPDTGDPGEDNTEEPS